MNLVRLFRRNTTIAPQPYRRHQYSCILIFIVAVALIGWHESGSNLYSDLLLYWLAYCITVIGFYWIFGVAGRFAFCQTLMMLLGAYLSAYISREGGPLWFSLLGAVVGVALVAALFGYMLRRTRALYFGMATLALTEVGLDIFTQWSSFTGSGGEVINVPPLTVFGRAILSNMGLTLYFLVALAIILVLNAFMERSPLYREAIGARELEVVTRCAGVRVTSIQVALFSAGSAAGGLSGALLVHANGYVGASSFGIDLSVGIFLMLLLGGRNSVWGPVIGAAVYVGLPQILQSVQQYQTIIYGAILLVVIIAMPEGLIKIGETTVGWFRSFRRRTSASIPDSEGTDEVAALSKNVDEATVPSADDGMATKPLVVYEPAVVNKISIATRSFPMNRAPQEENEDTVLEAADVSVHFSGVRAVDGVSLRLQRGEVLGIIGPNGSGKSTLINALTGVVPAKGQLIINEMPVKFERPRASRDAGLARTFQSPQVIHPLSSLENVLLGFGDHAYRGVVGSWLLRPWMWRHERPRWMSSVDLLSRVGLRGALQSNGGELSYGDQRRVDVGRALSARPAVMMLDEPSAGLNDEETIELAHQLRAYRDSGISLVVVDHKLGLIEEICDRILVLQLGQVIAEGTPEEIWNDPAVVDAYLGNVDVHHA